MTDSDITGEKPQIPERILVAAARVMEREGFANASLRQIAEEAGMTKAGLYYHVASKETLLYALHERFAIKLRDSAQRISESDAAPTDKLRALIVETVQTAGVYQSEGTVFLREYAHLTGEMAVTVGKGRDQFRTDFETVIKEGMDSGEFRSGDAHLDALAILGACNFTAFWFDPEGAMKIEQIADAFADRLLYGMRTPGNDKGEKA
ncbi:TetR family transcriptional regulator [Mycolicibacterium chitae]|uniref:TetR family transcriptional regulator n=1 Tax=Mycolicibacterium chitae TaxID=1792 RepID=A0A3S4S9Z5_MYCCI|nr:TetR/AcrR family transcriptional regulator [Mycolicibacterium chitae]MCV7109203.1 TetR/AcrR family transcriptional regulator [Mycolicibacterium chitae]BBZ04821.1 TetR family transcriptional regulator [Mycolicibacterium chitae]VEG48447.1 TetR family transcriptional regulator [Mycolicibacterium chitae]